jgi:hypothetical protein
VTNPRESMRIDPATGATLLLAEKGVTAIARDGTRRFIPAPHGYAFSHFAEGVAIVGRGDRPIEGWQDWHFEVDVEAGIFRRLGPAY